jgi:hypothetical protein
LEPVKEPFSAFMTALAIEGVLVHAAEGVDQLTVGAVARGVVGQLRLAGWVIDAFERLLHLGDLERYRLSPSLAVRQPRGYHPEARSNHRAGVLGARECAGGPDLVDAVQQRVQHDLGGGELALELLHGPAR